MVDKKEEVFLENMEAIAKQIKSMFSSERWEDRIGAITGSVLIIDQYSKQFFEKFSQAELIQTVKSLIEDSEYRVRLQLSVLIKTVI